MSVNNEESNDSLIITNTVPATFEIYHKEYLCCCGCMHCRTGSIVIGVLELIGVVLNTTNVLINYCSNDDDQREDYFNNLAFSLFSTTVTLVVVALLFYAVCKEKKFLIIPHLLYQFLGICLLMIVLLITAVRIGSGKHSTDMESHESSSGNGHLIVIVVLLVASTAVEIWFFTIVYTFYCYLKDKPIWFMPSMRYTTQK